MSTELQSMELEKTLPQSTRRLKLLRLASMGLNAKRAAEVLGLNAELVRREYRDPAFKRMCLERLEGVFEEVDEKEAVEALTLHDRIRAEGDRAFNVLVDLLQDKEAHPAVRAKVAMDILDRNPETQSGTQSTIRHEVLNAEMLMRAARAAEEMDKVVPIKRQA